MTPSSERLAAGSAVPAVAARPVATGAETLQQEAVLLAGLRRGDDDAFEELVRTHGGRLLAVARRMLRNEEDARDAVQQALLSAFRALPNFNGESQLSTWLHRIVVNASLMKLRTRSRRPEVSIEDLLPRFLDDGHHAETWSDWSSSVDVLLEQRETRERVRAAIDRLPESYRTVLMLRDIEELDTSSTASLLEVTPNAVKIKLHRARQALARLLESEFRISGNGTASRRGADDSSAIHA